MSKWVVSLVSGLEGGANAVVIGFDSHTNSHTDSHIDKHTNSHTTQQDRLTGGL